MQKEFANAEHSGVDTCITEEKSTNKRRGVYYNLKQSPLHC